MQVSWRLRIGTVLTAAVVAAGCGAGENPATEREAEGAGATEVSVSGEGLIPGTPAGGLADWVADIRSGLEEVPALAADEAAKAQEAVLNLYVSRQEYIEMYYGLGGRLNSDKEALGAAIDGAEARFHDLMQLLAETPAPEAGRVEDAVAALDGAYDGVLEAARDAGVPEAPPASSPAAGEES